MLSGGTTMSSSWLTGIFQNEYCTKGHLNHGRHNLRTMCSGETQTGRRIRVNSTSAARSGFGTARHNRRAISVTEDWSASVLACNWSYLPYGATETVALQSQFSRSVIVPRFYAFDLRRRYATNPIVQLVNGFYDWPDGSRSENARPAGRSSADQAGVGGHLLSGPKTCI